MQRRWIVLVLLVLSWVAFADAKPIIRFCADGLSGPLSPDYWEAGASFQDSYYASSAPSLSNPRKVRVHRGPSSAAFGFRIDHEYGLEEGDYFIHYTVGHHPYKSSDGNAHPVPSLFQARVNGKTIHEGVVYFDTVLAVDQWHVLDGVPVHLSRDSSFELIVRVPEGSRGKGRSDTDNALLIADAIMLDQQPRGIIPPNTVRDFVLNCPRQADKKIAELEGRLQKKSYSDLPDFYSTSLSWADLNLCRALVYDDDPERLRKKIFEVIPWYLGWKVSMEKLGAVNSDIISGDGYGLRYGLIDSFAGNLDKSLLENRIGICAVIYDMDKPPKDFLSLPLVKSNAETILAEAPSTWKHGPSLLQSMLFTPSLERVWSVHFAESRVDSMSPLLKRPLSDWITTSSMRLPDKRYLFVRQMHQHLNQALSPKYISEVEKNQKDCRPLLDDPFVQIELARQYLMAGNCDRAATVLQEAAESTDTMASFVAAELARGVRAYAGDPSAKATDVVKLARLDNAISTKWSGILGPKPIYHAADLFQANHALRKDWIEELTSKTSNVPGLVIESISSKASTATISTDVCFSDIERGFERFSRMSPARLRLGERFATSVKLDRNAVADKAIAYMSAHPDSILSCRLYSDLSGDVIDLSLPAQATALAEIVKKHPQSALAVSIVSRYLMQRVYWPSINAAESFEKHLESILPNTAAALMLSAQDPQALPAEQLAKLIDYYRLCAKKYPNAIPSTLLLMPVRGGKIEYFRRCEALLNSCNQVQEWLVLERRDKAADTLHQCEALWLSLLPNNPMDFVANDSLRSRYMQSREKVFAALSSTPAEGFPVASAAMARARVASIASLLRLASSMDLPAEVLLGSVSPKTIKTAAVQQYLDDFALIAGKGNCRDALMQYTAFMGKDLMLYLSDEELKAVLKWLSKNVDNIITKALPEFLEYQRSVAGLYNVVGDKTESVRRYQLVADASPHSNYAYHALQQLSHLYRANWNMPEKSLQALRRIVADFQGSSMEYEARLEIAKLLYDQKEYEKAIYEISRLLTSLPKTYSDKGPRMMLALAYIACSKMEDARNELALVINSDTEGFREKALYLMGYSFICEQKYSEATKPFTDLLNLYPNGEYREKAYNFLKQISSAGDGGK